MADSTTEIKVRAWPAIIVGILTVTATLITAVPGFLALRTKRSLIAYDLVSSEIAYPLNSDRVRIKEILDKERIPDSSIILSVENIGDQPASSVQISIKVPGEILAHKSIPSNDEKPAWVTIRSDFDQSKSSSIVSYELTKLAVKSRLKIEVNYRRNRSGEVTSEIFSDGFAAVPSDSARGEKKSYGGLLTPISILTIGMILTTIVYFWYKIKHRPEIGRLLITLLSDSYPFMGTFRLPLKLAAETAYISYCNNILLQLVNDTQIKLLSIAEGKFGANDSNEFWDIQGTIGRNNFAIDAHTASQNFFDDGRLASFCVKLSIMTKRIGGTSFVAFDKEPKQKDSFENTIKYLNLANPDNPVIVVYGEPTEVVKSIRKYFHELPV